MLVGLPVAFAQFAVVTTPGVPGEPSGRGNPSLLQCPYCARCGSPQALSVASARHRTADAMMAAIPEAVVRELTVETLAILITAMNQHWHNAIAFAESSACIEGGIWDATRLTFRELR